MRALVFTAVYSLIVLANPAFGQKVKVEPNTVDHAGILRQLGPRHFAKGRAIYNNLCINCHGSDGKTPALPIARAFGTG